MTEQPVEYPDPQRAECLFKDRPWQGVHECCREVSPCPVSSQPAYPGYATPTFMAHDVCWIVTAHPWGERIGWVESHSPEGWTAIDARSHYVGLFPTQQAAGEALVKHAGFEVLG